MSNFQSSKIQVLNKLLMVGLEVNIWSARKKLRAEDLGDDLQLPPSELASLGSKRTIDPDHIKPFERLKRRAVRLLEVRGTKFMGAYAIPESIAGEVAAELESIEREFMDAKVDFLAAYDQSCNEWLNRPWEKPEWREAISRAITPKAVVEARLGYRFSLCRVLPDESSPILSKGLEREVQGLSGQLFREIADEAEDISENTLRGAASVTQKTVNRIWKMHAKLTSLAFLSPEVQGLADFLAKQLLALPKSGKLEGSDFQNLFSLVLNLSDETKIATLADVFDEKGDLELIADVEELTLEANDAACEVSEEFLGADELLIAGADDEAIAPLEAVAELVPEATAPIADVVSDMEFVEQFIDMAQAEADALPATVAAEIEQKIEVDLAAVPEMEPLGDVDFCM